MDVKALLNKTYVFPALPNANSTAGNIQGYSSIETAIGILCACITLSVVLLFLYKVVKRKQESMITELTHRVRLSRAETVHSGTETERPCSNFSYITTSTPKRNNKVAPSRNDSGLGIEHYTQISKPYPGKVRRNDITKTSYTEDVKPTTRRRTRKIPTLGATAGALSDYKAYMDIDMHDAKDILLSLKADMASLRGRIDNRVKAVKGANRRINDCANMLSNAKKYLRELSSEGNSEKRVNRKTFVRAFDSKKISIRKSSPIKWTADSNEALVSMQYWFQGLKLHPQLRDIAEDIVNLQNEHRRKSEIEMRQISTFAKSFKIISTCQSVVKETSARVKELRESNQTSLMKIVANNQKLSINSRTKTNASRKNRRNAFVSENRNFNTQNSSTESHTSRNGQVRKQKVSKSDPRLTPQDSSEHRNSKKYLKQTSSSLNHAGTQVTCIEREKPISTRNASRSRHPAKRVEIPIKN